ncbi:MAG: trigger factor [Planctomycetales bacterium]|nr:trigger factor [Planctomycetales bacterium]NIM07710.1 trigger factor [Planctomycetales bacterium]NIN07214.1 trigger factor [Planctomycetales bacterium]NIN76307.1 trigger factor [Planctomycetales bacterium]NIO33512.1 trigger factor [Planctomycetales bacterium]
MATDETLENDVDQSDQPAALQLDVQIDKPSACQRHITVTVAREDIDRYLDEAFSDMMGAAAVPGFRAGRAPRKLIEARYRDDVADQIKGTLLMDCMAQINEEHKLSAISEPDIDLEAVELPAEGPFTFEFDLEVRPDFKLPQWKGLKVERPMREFDDADVQRQLQRMLANQGRRVPSSQPAEEGDYLTCHITVSHEGRRVREAQEESFALRPVLSFRDGKIEQFDKLMQGVTAGQTRETKLKVSQDAANPDLAGQEVAVSFEVLDVKKFELPEMTADHLLELGEFDSEGDLRDAVKDQLERQLHYAQQQRARQQITQLLTEAADWDLPPELLKRQSSRELERIVLELRRSGFTDDMIRAHVNELRQNSRENTARALREHFILERIAEEEEIDALPDDYDQEIALIAVQGGESPRRVRARIEKQGLMDALRNQIIERKVVEKVLEHAKFKDVNFQLERDTIEAVDMAVAGGEESEIPVAHHADAEKLAEPKDHT